MNTKCIFKNFIILSVLSFFIMSCQKNELSDNYPSTVSDIDGNVYKTVLIGDQLWMAENLKTTKYNDGLMINYGEVFGGTVGEYFWYNNDEKNKNVYGALYNWYAVGTGKLAPKGWHVAADEDWEKLKTTLGGNLVTGGRIKTRDFIFWIEPNVLVGDDSGFNAYPSGMRNLQGKFTAIGEDAVWWTSLENDEENAYSYNIENENSKIGFDFWPKTAGFSVRCVKD